MDSQKSSKGKKRKKRRDANQKRLTERDLFLLGWLADMYAIRFDHLQVLAGRYSTKAHQLKEAKQLSYRRTMYLLARWQDSLEVAEARRYLYKHPMWVWPTKKGLEVANADLPYYKPSLARLKHIHAVNGVRLHIEALKLKGQYMPYKKISWTSERVVNLERKERGRRHIVDGELFVSNMVVGIEVELAVKSQPNLSSILRELREDYESIWYFTSQEAQSVVGKAVDKLGSNRDQFKIYPLPELSYW